MNSMRRYYAAWNICTHRGSSIETANRRIFCSTITATSEYPIWGWQSTFPMERWSVEEWALSATWVIHPTDQSFRTTRKRRKKQLHAKSVHLK